MNKIYKLKFDKRRNELVAVSEITTGMGKDKCTGHIAGVESISPFRKYLGVLKPLSLLTGMLLGALPAMTFAAELPVGGTVVGGQGSITTSGNQMTIHQQTQQLATDWHSFDIGRNHTVEFIQPDSSAVALNRVTGASGSQIMGTLKANGQVFILNPNGIVFGKDARVNVAGLLASTKNINVGEFMQGKVSLQGGNPDAWLINQGSLTTSPGGYIVLAGSQVKNSGTITTPAGKTVLASAEKITLQLDKGGLTSVTVNGSVVNSLIENQGLISATDGQVYLTARAKDMLLNTVINNTGVIEARGLSHQGGEIVLSGGDSGVVRQDGTLLADSSHHRGGKITVEGENIHLTARSKTSATGMGGGGEVYVGGGWQGRDSAIKNASKVVMDKGAIIDVSATEQGNGGQAVLWSEEFTNFRGTVFARGGKNGGNGGQVETSSHQNLQAFGEVDASAAGGKGGEWLLDPTDVTIVGSGADTGTSSTGGVFTPTASGAQILNTSITNQLNNGTSVTVKTSGNNVDGQSGNISINADITKSSGGNSVLTFSADGNITLVNHTITSSMGTMDVIFNAGGSSAGLININNSTVNTNGGNINIGTLNKNGTNDIVTKIISSNLSTVASDSTRGNIHITGKKSFASMDFINPVVWIDNSTIQSGGFSIESRSTVVSGNNNSGGMATKLSNIHFDLTRESHVNATTNGFYSTYYDGTAALVLSGKVTLDGSGTLNLFGDGGANSIGVRGTNDIIFNVSENSIMNINATSGFTKNDRLHIYSAAMLFAHGVNDVPTNLTLNGGGQLHLNSTSSATGNSSAVVLGNVSVNNGSNIYITGNAAGLDGKGVIVANINAADSSKAFVTGTALQGTGVVMSNVDPNQRLTNVTVNITSNTPGHIIINGDSGEKVGVFVNNSTTVSGVTITGNSTNGTGVELAGNVSNSNVTGQGNTAGVNVAGNVTGGSVNGTSANGTGVELAGNVSNSNVTGQGNTAGVNVSGNVTGGSVNGTSA
ncbi:filamentous hemagglutinin N-terminal domain-containing protein, partial [Salmonella enterica]|nr:filamentous hemagglutinin N-terminal domain-containing protein [Salmonella enterica]